ncbi:hypothetical protein VTI28DRAFT_8688 [Corynascus sepedonium]
MESGIITTPSYTADSKSIANIDHAHGHRQPARVSGGRDCDSCGPQDQQAAHHRHAYIGEAERAAAHVLIFGSIPRAPTRQRPSLMNGDRKCARERVAR